MPWSLLGNARTLFDGNMVDVPVYARPIAGFGGRALVEVQYTDPHTQTIDHTLRDAGFDGIAWAYNRMR